jgi:hypothetical protein
MPKPFLVLVLFLSLITCAPIYAQKNREPKQRDSSIIIFSESPRPGKKSINSISGDGNIIKISPLAFLNGYIPVYYERRIADFFTIQAGVGVTTRNYIRGLLYNALDQDNASNQNIKYTWNTSTSGEIYGAEDGLYDYEYRKTKPGYYVSLQPRIYIESDAPEGYFFGISLDHYQYNFQSQGLSGNGSNTRGNKTIDEYEKMNDIMVIFGGQSLFDRITLEYTSGIGVRKIKGEKYAVAMDGNGKYVEGMANYKKTTLNLEATIKIGFHF